MSEIIKSRLDNSEYEKLTISNGVEVLLVSNKRFKRGCISVSMNVGSFNEDPKFKGLAHFLEHMLFMGTKKFPSENYFNEIVNKYGGRYNAFTSDQKTVYFCDIHKDMFDHLIDVFSSFFISPLFNENGINREVNAVNSEYLNTLNSHVFRHEAVLKEFIQDDHPFKNFNCGNLETLQKEGIYKEMKKFFMKYYSSNKCAVVLSNSLSIEELRKRVEVFNQVSVNDNIDRIPIRRYDYFLKEEFQSSIIKVKPLEDKKSLIVHFTTPSSFNFIEENPFGIICYELEKNSKGSLISKLVKAGLGTFVDVSNNTCEEYDLIEIEIGLTDEGIKQHEKVLNILYDSIREVNITREYYDVVKARLDLDFEYLDDKDQLQLTRELAMHLKDVPFKHLLSNFYITTKYDMKIIDSYLNCFKDYSKWIVLLYTQEGPFTNKDKYYSVEYKIIDKLSLNDRNVDLSRNLISLPLKNFSLIESIKCNDEFVKYRDYYYKKINMGSKNLIYCFDKSFKDPSNIFTLSLISDDYFNNLPFYEVCALIVFNYFEETNFDEIENSRTSFSITTSTSGLEIGVKGFNSMRTLTILKKALDYFTCLSKINDEEIKILFPVFKSKIIGEYESKIKVSPYKKSFDVFNQSFIKGLKSYEEYLEMVKNMKLSDLPILRKVDYSIDLFSVGNFDYQKVFDFLKGIESIPLERNIINNEVESVVNYPVIDKFNNSVNYMINLGENYQLGFFYSHVINELFFDSLRTKEALGYIVFNTIRLIRSKRFVCFVVQSEKDGDFLINRINDFIVESQKYIKELSNKDFEEFKKGFIIEITKPFDNLTVLHRFVHNKYQLDENINQELETIKIINNLKLSDFINFVNDLTKLKVNVFKSFPLNE
ncbi:STE23 [Hepatospora eriocheir]|uniref:STE23 n=1 Tax=Hepatospora eriocheir TaxID=1081669 RepID=A0A1X0QAS8_9MICR|nr:STE23 [Hepatospora eriocheir]